MGTPGCRPPQSGRQLGQLLPAVSAREKIYITHTLVAGIGMPLCCTYSVTQQCKLCGSQHSSKSCQHSQSYGVHSSTVVPLSRLLYINKTVNFNATMTVSCVTHIRIGCHKYKTEQSVQLTILHYTAHDHRATFQRPAETSSFTSAPTTKHHTYISHMYTYCNTIDTMYMQLATLACSLQSLALKAG